MRLSDLETEDKRKREEKKVPMYERMCVCVKWRSDAWGVERSGVEVGSNGARGKEKGRSARDHACTHSTQLIMPTTPAQDCTYIQRILYVHSR